MPLTDVAVRTAKPGANVIKLSDGGGLQLYVTPAGGKHWKLAYRFDGKQMTMRLGPYPSITLAEARDRRSKAKALLADGIDPAKARENEEVERAAAEAAKQALELDTFGRIADEYLAKVQREGLSEGTVGKLRWILSLVGEEFAAKPLTTIKAKDVLAVLKRVEERGRLETAGRLRETIGRVFRYAIATARAETDPTPALLGALTAPKVTHRAAILDPQKFGGLLRAIEHYDGQPTTRAAFKLLAYLFPRPGELRQAEWREFDLDRAVWTIPASRSKMRREHRIPLPHQALEVLKEIRPYAGPSGLLFQGFGVSGGLGRKVAPKPISEVTLLAGLRRMGYAKEEMSAHGFRSVASTFLNTSGRFNPDAIEAALAHMDPNKVRKAYNRGDYFEERVAMMAWWADHIDGLRDGAKVVPIRA